MLIYPAIALWWAAVTLPWIPVGLAMHGGFERRL